ncbi:protein similar isoform X3 [Drosophila subobscura]|uniref:protein similar isoform X3 n=1 Tax=Drosophila subobscura TaxID=7241 RepID=UPI00155B1946|nr:protein similar isoform X3 [Drosophila subobscura]
MFNSCNAWENCDFSCPGETATAATSFYGEDPFFDCDLKPQLALGNGSVYGCMPINEPTVNFSNGSFYNAADRAPMQQQQLPPQRPYVGAMLAPSAPALRYHPYQQQQDAFYQQRGSLLNVSTPCRESRPWSYAHCYGYTPTNTQPCQFSQFVDIEDFMNNEKRKEKSRDAARCRRSKETEIFMELSQVLPLKNDDVNQLDKASVMRITIAFLKIREMLQFVPALRDCKENQTDIKQDMDEVKPKLELSSEEWLNGTAEASQLLKETMDGFLLVLSHEGDITYVSENVVEYLGITKIDTLGQPIWEYAHQCDHAEIKEALNQKRHSTTPVKDEQQLESGVSTHHRDLFVRLKCTLTNRGRSINIKSALYKVIHITGHLVVNGKGERVLIAIGRPIPNPANIEIPLGTSTFLTKHSLDMRFTYVDDKMLGLLGYAPNDLLDTSLFGCQHGADSERLMATFKSVISKGQGETCRYRFLGKCGGYCWIVSQATIVYDKQKPQSVVCVNYVISNLENKHEIYSLAQQTAASEQKEQQQQQQQQTATDIENNNNNKTETTTTTTPEETSAKTNATPIELEEKPQAPTESKEPASEINNNPEPEKTPIATEITAAAATNNNPPTITTETTTAKPPNNQLQQAELHIKRENHSPGPRTITAQLISTATTNSGNSLRLEEKRPKSVTASVFRPSPAPPLTATPPTAPAVGLGFKKTTEPTLPPTTTATAAILSSSNQQQNPQQNLQATQDMSKGFLSFVDDGRGLTMLKEEPDDLSHHLASTNCIQLDEMTPFSDMLVGLMSSCLLPDEINSLDSTTCSTTASVAPHYQSSSSHSHSGSQSSSYASSPLSPLTPTGVVTTAGGAGGGAAANGSSTPSNHSSSNQQQQHQQQHQQQQQQQQQQHFSNSLCSSPASTVSSLSPSPVQQQQQQQQTGGVFTTDSSELAALLCGTGNGTLSILGESGANAAEERLQQQQASSDFRSFQQLQQELQLQEEQQQQEEQQRQQQQQQQQMISLSIECKKEKYEVPMAPSLSHSIEDAFENDYSKDSSNLDCWDLLQMNVAEAGVSPAASPSPCKVATIQLLQHQQQQLQQQQQNIILNAVPLITIQNNKSILQQQQQQQQQELQELMQSSKQQAPVATMKLLNGASIAPVTTKATIRLVESKPQQTTTQQQQRLGKATMLQTLVPQQQQHGNKRHLNSQTSQGNPVESKRLKSGTLCLDVQSPQLLQQLIGKDSAQQQTLAAKRAASERWQQTAEGKQQQKLQQQQQQQSNSVLKNLLVSGRDVNQSEEVSEPMIIDDNGLDQTAQKSAYGKYGLPLHCHTSTSAVLRNYHHNPLISGTNFQLSPVFSGSDAGGGDGDAGSVVSLDDSVPPGLTACDTDASSDSGIDENSLVEGASVSPRKRVHVSHSEEAAPPPLDVVPQQQQQQPQVLGEEEAEGCPTTHSRKTSISFLDNSNPLLHTPAMMDLCNDDYIMSEGGFEFSENQLEQVLGWSEIA